MDALKLYNLESVQTKKVYTLPTKKAKIIQQPQKEELKLIYICYQCRKSVQLNKSQRVSCPSCQRRVVYKQASNSQSYKSI